MSSNESVERMLKQLENLLRQQDKDQTRETEAELEPVAAGGGSPGPSEEQGAADLPPTPVVELVDTVDSQAVVDGVAEPVYRATGDSVPVGLAGAQGLKVETVPTDEDYEIGGSAPAEAGVEVEQASVASETPSEPPSDTHAGPGSGPRRVPDIGIAEIGAIAIEDTPGDMASVDEPVGLSVPDQVTIEEAAGVNLPVEPPAPEVGTIEDAADVNLPVEPPAPEVVTIGEAAGLDLPVEPPEPLVVTIEEEDDDGAEDEELPHRRRRFSIGDLLNRATLDKELDESDSPTQEEIDSGQEEVVAASDHDQPAGPSGESREISAAGPVEVHAEGSMAEAEAEPARTVEENPDHIPASVDSGSDTEDDEEAESPTSKYPSWWFRGGSVHTSEGSEDVVASNGGGELRATDVHGLDGSEVEKTTETAASTTRPDVEPFVHRDPVVGPPPVRKLISEQLQEQELAAELQSATEEEARDVAESPGDVIIGVEGISAVSEPPDAVPGEEPGVVEVVEDSAEDVIDPARALKIVESLAEVMANPAAEASEEVAQVEEDGALDDEVGDFFAAGPQVPLNIDMEAGTAAEGEPDPVSPQADQPTANQPEVEIPTAEAEAPVIDLPRPEAEAPVVDLPRPEAEAPVIDVPRAEVEVPVTDVPRPVMPREETAASPLDVTPVVDSTPKVDAAPTVETATERPRRRLTARLGTLLLDAHLISERDLDRALEEHQATGERLGHYLVDHGMVEEKDLANVLSDQYGVPAADVETIEVPSEVLALVPAKMARRYMVMPLAVSEGVADVAMVDPSDINAIKDLEFTTGLRVQPLIATEWSIERAIERIYSGEEPRSALTGRAAAKAKGPRAIIRRMVRDRDEAVLQTERDPHRAYELAASIDDFVDEILKVAEKPQD